MKVKFANYEYSLLPNGYATHPERATFLIFADDVSLGDFESVIRTACNLDRIEIIDDYREDAVVEVITGFPVIDKLQKIFDYTYMDYSPLKEESEEEEEQVEPVEVVCDVIHLVLCEPRLQETVEKNTADIEYIAIMSDIELE